MLAKINRQDCLDQYQVFPQLYYDEGQDEERFVYPNVFKDHILVLPLLSFDEKTKHLGIELCKLTMAIDAGYLIFMGETETPWRYQQNAQEPVEKALEYLAKNRVENSFNGGLLADVAELPAFIEHIVWLTRCNAALPNFHFIDPCQNIVGNICQYGNLHLSTLNEQTDDAISLIVNTQSKLQYKNENNCSD